MGVFMEAVIDVADLEKMAELIDSAMSAVNEKDSKAAMKHLKSLKQWVNGMIDNCVEDAEEFDE